MSQFSSIPHPPEFSTESDISKILIRSEICNYATGPSGSPDSIKHLKSCVCDSQPFRKSTEPFRESLNPLNFMKARWCYSPSVSLLCVSYPYLGRPYFLLRILCTVIFLLRGGLSHVTKKRGPPNFCVKKNMKAFRFGQTVPKCWMRSPKTMWHTASTVVIGT